MSNSARPAGPAERKVEPGRAGKRTMRLKAAFLCMLATGAFLVGLLAPAACATAFATDLETVSSTELIEHPEKYDRRRVAYEGEAVGDILRRGDSAWLTLNDDEYRHRPHRSFRELKGGNTGIGVYGPYELASKITRLGSYDSLGDLVIVEGVFYAASPAHGGDLMIEFDTLTVARAGRRLTRNHVGGKLVALAALLAVSIVLAYLLLRVRKRLVDQL